MRGRVGQGELFTVTRVSDVLALLAVVAFLLPVACARAPQPTEIQPILGGGMLEQKPTAGAVTPAPTDTAEPATVVPVSTPTARPATPTPAEEKKPATVTAPPSVTPTETGTEAPTEVPTATVPRETPTRTPLAVTGATVIYHNGFSQGGVGIYERGGFPWLDLLVRLGETWYGPEREPDDGIQAIPLPDRYRWQAEGSFRTLPNGEAWWEESGTQGVAWLTDAGGAVLVELPLRVVFRDSGGGGREGGTGPRPTPT